MTCCDAVGISFQSRSKGRGVHGQAQENQDQDQDQDQTRQQAQMSNRVSINFRSRRQAARVLGICARTKIRN